MSTYTLRQNPGCVVHEFKAVRFLGDTEPVKSAFPFLDITQVVPGGGLVVTDKRRSLFVTTEDWIVETEPELVIVVSDQTFQDTYHG